MQSRRYTTYQLLAAHTFVAAVLQVGLKARGVALRLLCLVYAFVMLWDAIGTGIHKNYETAIPARDSPLFFFPTFSSLLTPLGKYWRWISPQYSVPGRMPWWRIRLAVDHTICFGDYTFHCISWRMIGLIFYWSEWRCMTNGSTQQRSDMFIFSGVVIYHCWSKPLALTCERKAKPDLYTLAKELTPTDGEYQTRFRKWQQETSSWLGTFYSSRCQLKPTCTRRPPPFHSQL